MNNEKEKKTMKKLKWMLLLVVVLLMALPAVALADDGIASPEFFT